MCFKITLPKTPGFQYDDGMGILKPVLDFLFGKDPDIFDANGNVIHKHPKKKWDDWQNRLKLDPAYNWRHHTGTQAGQSKTQNSKN